MAGFGTPARKGKAKTPVQKAVPGEISLQRPSELQARGNLAEANALAEKAIQRNPRHPVALANLAGIHLQMGRAREAVDAYRRALKLQPGDADLHCRLAIALQSTGDGGAAAGSYRKAIRLAPDHAEAHARLGNLMLEEGDTQAARSLAQRALDLRPDYTEALILLGNASRAADALPDAVAAFRRAVALRPHHPGACTNLGLALLESGDPDGAIGCFQQLVASAPQHAEAHRHLGMALYERGDLDAAMASLERALELQPDRPQAWLDVGQVLRAQGNLPQAIARCDRALDLDPDCADAHYSRSVLRRAPRGSADLAAALLSHSRALQPRDRVLLGFAIGKMQADMGQYREAFSSYRAANQEQFRLLEEPISGREKRLAFSLELNDAFPAIGSPIGGSTAAEEQITPILIVGLPRCGSTLVETILSMDQETICLGEAEVLPRMIISVVQEPSEQRAHLLRESYLHAMRNRPGFRSGGRRFTDKNLSNYLFCGLIHQCFPLAKIVHVIRHPMDHVLSIYATHFGKGNGWTFDLDAIVARYDFYRRVMKNWQQNLGGAIYECDYDRLVSDPGAQIPALLGHLGIAWSDKFLRHQESRQAVKTASVFQVRQPIHTGSLRGWRHYFEELLPVARQFERMGYLSPEELTNA
jgi:tetratricopeptide (TPR) repeat protein